jgi:hypothetical protein
MRSAHVCERESERRLRNTRYKSLFFTSGISLLVVALFTTWRDRGGATANTPSSATRSPARSSGGERVRAYALCCHDVCVRTVASRSNASASAETHSESAEDNWLASRFDVRESCCCDCRA